jgi:hypothetical protein
LAKRACLFKQRAVPVCSRKKKLPESQDWAGANTGFSWKVGLYYSHPSRMRKFRATDGNCMRRDHARGAPIVGNGLPGADNSR